MLKYWKISNPSGHTERSGVGCFGNMLKMSLKMLYLTAFTQAYQ